MTDIFPEKFDYVVVNGVLEYAMSFTGGKNSLRDISSAYGQLI